RLAYACCGVRNLLCDVLGVISAWGLKMIKRLDRVKLTARAAAASTTTSAQACLTGPLGAAWSSASPPTKPTWSCCGTGASRWMSSQSAALSSNQSWDFPKPSTDCEPRRRIHLAFAILVCHPMRFGNLDAAIRVTADDSDGRRWWPRSHVDRARIRRQP